MKVTRTIRTALRALRRNVTRSALTVLGIVIGIAAVIAMMEIGKGSSSAIASTIASMGANNMLIMPGTAASGGVSFGAGTTLTLTAEDCDAILRDATAIGAASPIVRSRAQVIFENKNWVPQQILGCTPAYLDVRQWSNLTEGDIFTDTDVRNASKVCLVGQTIVREVFEGHSPIGKEVRLQNVSFRVVGVLSSKGANAFGQDQDDIVLAPWTTIKYRLSSSSSSSTSGSTSSGTSTSTGSTSSNTSGGSIYPGSTSVFPPQGTSGSDQPMPVRFANVDQIIASAASAQQVQQALGQVTQVLHDRHRIRDGEPDDFTIRDMTEMASALNQTTSMMTNLLLAVALISLVVGGVGIMNIMLVSVTERTREIGLRMAVGARAKDVLLQFLTEATILCLVGGFVGLGLGRGAALLVRTLLGWPVEPSLQAVIASIVVSAAVGIAFGFYPAWKASKLDPIEALRYE